MSLTEILRQKLLLIILWVQIIAFILRPGHTYVMAMPPGNNSDDAIRLLRDMIEPFDYRIRPILNQSRPIKVYFSFNINSLLDIDEVQQNIIFNFWANFSWWDELRTWNPDDYGGNDVIHPHPLDIWRPRTVLTNSVGKRDIFEDNYTPLSIYSTGSSRWYVGGLFHFICFLDLTYFPFDTQTCKTDIMSNELGSEIELVSTTSTMIAEEYLINGEWELKSTRVTCKKLTISDDIFAFIYIHLTFVRRPMYYLVNVLMPVVILSFLSLFAFVVPRESGERASYSITVVLSLAVFMGVVADQLPPNSNTFPYISIYIFSLLCLSAVSVLIIMCQIRLTTTGGNEQVNRDLVSSVGTNGILNHDLREQSRKDRDNAFPTKVTRLNERLHNRARIFPEMEEIGGAGGVVFPHDVNHGRGGTDDNMTAERIIPICENLDGLRNLCKRESITDGLTKTDGTWNDEKPKEWGSQSVSNDMKINNHNRTMGIIIDTISKWCMEHGDLILFTIFTTLWLSFSFIFIHVIVNQPPHIPDYS